MEEDKTSKIHSSISIRHVVEAVDMPRSTFSNIMQSILRYYLHKLQLAQKLLPNDFETRTNSHYNFLLAFRLIQIGLGISFEQMNYTFIWMVP